MKLWQLLMDRRSKKSGRVHVWVCRRLPPEVWQVFSPLHLRRGAGRKEHLVSRKWIKFIVPAQIQLLLKMPVKQDYDFCFCLWNLVKMWFCVCLHFAPWAALIKSLINCVSLTAAWQERGRRHVLARAPTVCGWTRCDAQATSWHWSNVQKVLGGNTTASTLRMLECRAARFQVVLQAPASVQEAHCMERIPPPCIDGF